MDRVSVGDVTLACDVAGTGTPVLCVSGIHSARAWRPLAAELIAAGYQVVAFDNRGMLPSDVPEPPYSIEQLAADAAGVIEALRLGPCHVVGASLGGMITQALALHRPDLMRTATFVNAVGDMSPGGRVIIEAVVELYAMPQPPAAALRQVAMAVSLPVSRYHDKHALRDAARMGGELLNAETSPLPGRIGLSQATLEWAGTDHQTELADLHLPALVIASELDLLFPPALVRQAASRMPDARYIEIADSPHVFFDHLERIAGHLIPFIAEYDAENR